MVVREVGCMTWALHSIRLTKKHIMILFLFQHTHAFLCIFDDGGYSVMFPISRWSRKDLRDWSDQLISLLQLIGVRACRSRILPITAFIFFPVGSQGREQMNKCRYESLGLYVFVLFYSRRRSWLLYRNIPVYVLYCKQGYSA